MKKIKVNLDNIDKAIKEVKKYQKEVDRKTAQFIQMLTDEGFDILVTQVASLAFDTGELMSSIGTIMYVEENRGVIFSSSPHAVFVEFGAGVRKNAAGSYPGSWPKDLGGIGSYGKGQGRLNGWYYYSERTGKVEWTTGITSRPVFYNTLKELSEIAASVAKEVFK